MKRRTTVAAMAMLALPAMAQGDAEERLSRECNEVYAKLCKGIERGPELIGECFTEHPNIMQKIPSKCEADFQTNVENYRDAKTQR